VTFVGCCATATLAACGGGIQYPAPAVSASPDVVYTAVPQATLSPFTASLSAEAVPVPASTGPGAAQVTIALPSTSVSIDEMDLSAVDAVIPPGTTVDSTTTNQTLTDAPAPTSAVRGTDGIRTIEATAQKVVIEIVEVRFSQTVVLRNRPTFVFTFPSGFLIKANYYLEYYDTSHPALGWQDPFEGPGTINGNSLLFVDTKNTFTFAARVAYLFCLYAVSVRSTPTPIPATPTPTPVPSATPTATPTPHLGQLTVTPSTVSFDAPGQTETLLVNEAGYTGTFAAVAGNPDLVTIASPSPNQFLVTATSQPGRSTITVSDSRGQSVAIPFTVTITTGTISSRNRLLLRRSR
jgi:hypothetical protein